MAKYGSKIDQKKVYVRELIRSIKFSLEEIEKTTNQSPKEFHERMCRSSRIGFAMSNLYNGDGLIAPLKVVKQNGEK